MTALQTVSLGTPPQATDGDTARTAFTKVNSNVAVLSSQAALTSLAPITAAQALTAQHVGKRVNISLASPGVINMPLASTCGADNVVHLRNSGAAVATLASAAGSSDTVGLSKLNPGETAVLDTDGVSAWSVLMRGRANSDNEIVNGSLTVGSLQLFSPSIALKLQNTSVSGNYWQVGPDSYNNMIVYNANGYGCYIPNNGTSWVANSDEQLKNILSPITDAVAAVEKLRTVRYSLKSDASAQPKAYIGVIAQDVQKEFPELVSERDGYLGVQYSELSTIALAAIKELSAEIRRLKARLDEHGIGA